MPKSKGLKGGNEIIDQIKDLNLELREEILLQHFKQGNIPDFLKQLKPITFGEVINSKTYKVVIYVSVDYLSFGSDKDFCLLPMTPTTAERMGKIVDCSLPTRKMVDIIWKAAPIKLKPMPIPPSEAMTSIPIMHEHHRMVQSQKDSLGYKNGSKHIIAGHKKDVVRSNRQLKNKVHIYGWHELEGQPIQSLYSGHTDQWVDYSHGIRLVYNTVRVNGKKMQIDELLRDPELHVLLSDEGVFRYE
ncbi:MAG TPA: hypothetical protein PKD85_10105 [Saprospiraceae bacterium]|nr:hypothetical protein [Saprospiraceae bacterium]